MKLFSLFFCFAVALLQISTAHGKSVGAPCDITGTMLLESLAVAMGQKKQIDWCMICEEQKQCLIKHPEARRTLSDEVKKVMLDNVKKCIEFSCPGFGGPLAGFVLASIKTE
jgi:hypothetical protein